MSIISKKNWRVRLKRWCQLEKNNGDEKENFVKIEFYFKTLDFKGWHLLFNHLVEPFHIYRYVYNRIT